MIVVTFGWLPLLLLPQRVEGNYNAAAAAAEESIAINFVQSKVLPRFAEVPMLVANQNQKSKPWHLHNYVGFCHHKAGVYLLSELWVLSFMALGAKKSDMGMWMQPCYSPQACYSPKAPIQFWVDMYSAEKAQRTREAAGNRGLRVVGIVRDPISMIASAYCYHHRGKEMNNWFFFPARLLLLLGPKEGLKFVAERMVPMMENLTSAFEHQSNDTFRLDYEKVVGSSETFDQQMNQMIDFLFGDQISAAERSKVLNATQWADLNRHPRADDHGNDEACEEEVRQYVPTLPPDLLSQYRSYQQRLGYATT